MTRSTTSPRLGAAALLLALPLALPFPAAAAEPDGRILERSVEIRLGPDGRGERLDRRVVEYRTDFGWETWGDPWILHDARTQRVEIVTARTRLPDGTTLDVPPMAINELTLAELAAAPGEAAVRQTVVSHVGLVSGAVSELVVRTTDTAPPAAGYAAGEVALRAGLPVDRFSLRIEVPEGVTLRHACVGCDLVPAVVRSEGGTTYVWTAERLDGLNVFEGGASGVTPDEGLQGPRVVFSTAADWGAATEAARRVIEAPPAPEVTRRAAALAAEGAGTLDGVERLQAFVARDLAAAPRPRTLPPRPPEAPAAVLDRGYGTALERAVTLAALLRGIGRPATVVLVALPADLAPEVPFTAPFAAAWVLTRVDQRDLWLPADRIGLFAEPGPAGGRTLLRLDDTPAPETTAVTPPDPADARVEVRVSADGGFTAEATLRLAGLHNPYPGWRAADADPAAKLKGSLAGLVAGAEVEGSVRLEGYGPEAAAGRATLEGEATDGGDGLRVLAFGWPGREPWPAGMHRSDRETAVEWEGPFARSVRIEVSLPAGWEPALLPRSVRVESAAGVFEQSVTVGPRMVRIERRLEVRVRTVSPAEWPALRALHRAFVTAGSEALVVRPE